MEGQSTNINLKTILHRKATQMGTWYGIKFKNAIVTLWSSLQNIMLQYYSDRFVVASRKELIGTYSNVIL